MVKANHALSNSALVAAGNCSHVQFITTSLPPVYNVLHKTKFPSNVSEYKLSNNIKHSFFELDAWTKSKHTKLYWKKKKSNVKTESPLGKQKAREIWQALDSEGKCLLFRPIKEQRVKSWWFQLADLKTFSLVNKCTDIFTENIYFRINSEMEIWKEARPFITLTTFPPDQ